MLKMLNFPSVTIFSESIGRRNLEFHFAKKSRALFSQNHSLRLQLMVRFAVVAAAQNH
jgi:hypothetical protein